MNTQTEIHIATDFFPYPGGRYMTDGNGNGTEFRERFLVPILEAHKKAKIFLDGAPGYPSSFLEEAFGGLIRRGFSADAIKASFEIITTQAEFERFVALIREHIDRASAAHSQTGAGILRHKVSE
jgi:hypothetical protein